MSTDNESKLGYYQVAGSNGKQAGLANSLMQVFLGQGSYTFACNVVILKHKGNGDSVQRRTIPDRKGLIKKTSP